MYTFAEAAAAVATRKKRAAARANYICYTEKGTLMHRAPARDSSSYMYPAAYRDRAHTHLYI